MGLVDELTKLQQLKDAGALTDEEFRRAKQRLLEAEPPKRSQATHTLDTIEQFAEEKSTLGEAANRYVTYQHQALIVGALLFIVIAIIFAFVFTSANNSFSRPSPNQTTLPFSVPSSGDIIIRNVPR